MEGLNGAHSDSSAAPPPAPEDLGAELARLRREQKMTGQALAASLGISQGTISKIENGLLWPNPSEVERIATALGTAPEHTGRLVERAALLQAQSDRRPGRRKGSPGASQSRRQGVNITSDDYAKAESGARRLRNFEPILIPGLLQISEYTRRVVNAYQRVAVGGEKSEFYQRTADAVALRAERQRLLYDPRKKFEFTMLEAVLGNRFAPPEYMLAQIRRISAAAELDNVDIRVVPADVDLEYPQVQGFYILDDNLVMVETLEATAYHSPDRISIYTQVFEEYSALGMGDLDEILAKYTARYASLAMRTPAPAAPPPPPPAPKSAASPAADGPAPAAGDQTPSPPT